MVKTKPVPEALERSSYEFMVALVFASLTQLIPDWIAYLTCWGVLAVVGVYFCLYSRGTVGYGPWRKFFLSVCSLAFIGSISYSQVQSRYQETHVIPPAVRYMTSYGGFPPYDPLVLKPGAPPTVISGIPAGVVVVDGRLLEKYKEKFNVMAVAFHIVNSEPHMDKKGICKSPLMKIRPEDLQIRIDYNVQFLTEIEMGASGVNFVVLAVPVGVKPEDFSTLNEAEEKGVQLLDHGAAVGGPNVVNGIPNR